MILDYTYSYVFMSNISLSYTLTNNVVWLLGIETHSFSLVQNCKISSQNLNFCSSIKFLGKFVSNKTKFKAIYTRAKRRIRVEEVSLHSGASNEQSTHFQLSRILQRVPRQRRFRASRDERRQTDKWRKASLPC